MTDTTAKKGMIKYKKGYDKEGFDYAYLEEIPYNENLSVRNVVKGLESKDKTLELENAELKRELLGHRKLIESMEIKFSQLAVEVEDVRMKYYEALKGVITR